MRNDLRERHQGSGEPCHLPVRRVRALVVLTVAAAVVAVAYGAATGAMNGWDAPSAGLAEGTRRVVMVSGRDDHGLVATKNVALRSVPAGGDVVGHLPDGTLAQVREVRGNQVRVSASGLTGWVDDFVLRGELRLAGPPPGCRVSLAGLDLPAGTRVEVLSLDGATADVRLLDSPYAVGTVAASLITEMAPLPGQSCATPVS